MVPIGFSLLIDMGSTTTDIIPIWKGVPIPEGLTDRERLASGELVYTGVRRTPLCAVAREIPFRGKPCPVAAEFFATMQDVYLMLGKIAEDPQNLETANGKPATHAAARDRLARMICCDRNEFSEEDAQNMAEHFAAAQQRQIASAIAQVLSQRAEPLAHLLISGSGSFLVDQLRTELPALKTVEAVSLENLFQAEIAEAACAFAIARLAAERVQLG